MRVSTDEGWSDFFGETLVDCKYFFKTSHLGFGDLECDQEVGGDREGVLLLEWISYLDLLSIHSQALLPAP